MTATLVIGLGIMGGAMARHLAAAGVDTLGFDLDPDARARARVTGVATTEAVDATALAGRTVILSLPGPGAVEATLSMLVERAREPLVIVDTSTLSLPDRLGMAAGLEGRGHVLLDCPISGTGAQMAVRDVVFYASGDAAALECVQPLLDRVSRATVRLGAFGNGTRVKLIANYLVAIHNVATAEAMRMGAGAGIKPGALIEAIKAGAGSSRIFELRAPMVAEARYEPATMKLSVWAKDMTAIAAFARDIEVPSVLLAAVEPLYRTALDLGLGELDTAAVARALPSVQGQETT
jgi:putative dehydrogenase